MCRTGEFSWFSGKEQVKVPVEVPDTISDGKDFS